LATATPSASLSTSTSITPLAYCTGAGPTSSGLKMPRPPPSIMAGPAMPMLDDLSAMITSQQPTKAALPAKQRPETMPTTGTSPLSCANAAKDEVWKPEIEG
jgi:hypothetical protein